jgi:predicted Fe-Mo cluster-binding NifX family protein
LWKKFEEDEMKVAVSAVNRDENTYLDPRFGRANCFYVFDTESGEGEFVNNTQNFNAPHGAGIQTAQMIAEKGVEAVITGHVGPKASAVLEKENISIYIADKADILVPDALVLFREGKLKRAEGVS